MQTLGGTHVLEVPLDEVSEVQGAKEDAILEFHVDDGALRGREDALSSVTFVIPEGNEDFQGAASWFRGVAACVCGVVCASFCRAYRMRAHTLLLDRSRMRTRPVQRAQAPRRTASRPRTPSRRRSRRTRTR